MPEQAIPHLRRPPTAREMNRILAALRAAGRLGASDPFSAYSQDTGRALRFDPPPPFKAQITGGTGGGPYSWVYAHRDGSSWYASSQGGSSAYEINGKSVPSGHIVDLYPGYQGGHRFQINNFGTGTGGGGGCECGSCLVPATSLTLSIVALIQTGPPPSPYSPSPSQQETFTGTLTYNGACAWSGTVTIACYGLGVMCVNESYPCEPCTYQCTFSCASGQQFLLEVSDGCPTPGYCNTNGNGMTTTSLTCGSGFLWTGNFCVAGCPDQCTPNFGQMGACKGLLSWTLSA